MKERKETSTVDTHNINFEIKWKKNIFSNVWIYSFKLIRVCHLPLSTLNTKWAKWKTQNFIIVAWLTPLMFMIGSLMDMIKFSVLGSGIFIFLLLSLVSILFSWQLRICVGRSYVRIEWMKCKIYHSPFNWYRTSRTFDSINRLEIIRNWLFPCLFLQFIFFLLHCSKYQSQGTGNNR